MSKNVAIAVGLVLGLGLGLAAAGTQSTALLKLADGVAPLGEAFINLIKVVVVPLVAATLFTGVANLGSFRQLGRLGGMALAFYWGTTIVAITMGMAITAAALPLAGPAGTLQPSGEFVAPDIPGFTEFLVNLVPSNVFAVAAEGALLPLMVFTVLFGAAAGALPPPEKRRLLDLVDALTKALITLVHWILWTAPVGVFALAAPVTAKTGFDLLRNLGVFVGAVAVGLLCFVALVYLPAVKIIGKTNVRRFLPANLGTVTIAFSTTSTAATLPAMFEAAEDRLGVSRTVTSFVLPLGAALNRAGSALFQGSAIVFLAHLYGVDVAATAIGGAIVATFLVALTVAGVPSASVMTLPPALATVGIPLDGIGILLGVDRIPDMLRTAVNATGDVAACVILKSSVGAAQSQE